MRRDNSLLFIVVIGFALILLFGGRENRVEYRSRPRIHPRKLRVEINRPRRHITIDRDLPWTVDPQRPYWVPRRS